MKNLVIFLLIFILPSKILSQATQPDDVKVTYTSVNKSLAQVLNDLVQISGVNIVFSETKLNKTRKVKIQARQERLGSVLNIILQPYRLDYEIIGDNIVIVSKRGDSYGKNITISGFIRDKESGEALPFASLVDSIAQVSFEANENGFYSITVPRKTYHFKVSYLGYQPTYLSSFFSENSSSNLFLQSDNTLNEVLVSDATLDENNLEAGKKKFDKQRLSQATFLGGEADINRLVGMSSGVSTGADGFGGISVRGGSYDQNLILLDGVPLHHTGHALGLVSIFNSNVIQEATLYKSGFPSKYGGKLSSILDIRTREGNNKKLSGEIGLSTIASKITLEGPLVKDKASFLVSYRRTFANVWIEALSEYQNDINGDVGKSSYGFYDVNAKLNFSLGKNHKLFFSFYNGKDDFDNFVDSDKIIESSLLSDRQRNDLDWGSNMIAMHLNSKLGNRLFSRFIAYRSEWDFSAFNYDGFYIDRDSTQSEIYNGSLETSNIENVGARFELDFLATKRYVLRAGLIANRQLFSPSASYRSNLKDPGVYPDVLTKEDLLSDDNTEIESNELTVFLENEIRFNDNTTLTLGAHNSLMLVNGQSYFSAQPRFMFETGSKQSMLKVSVSNMVQYNQVLTDNKLGFPSDLWVTVTDRLKPASAWLASIGNVTRVNNSFTISGEFYYKWMSDLISLNEGGTVPFGELGNAWENSIPRGQGEAFGLEFDVFKRYGATSFDINYTYSKSNRRFDDLNNGILFAYKFDRTHMFNFNMKRTLGEKADVSLNFIYGTGNPTTLPTSDIVELESSEGKKFLSIIYEGKNNVRIKDYLRLDLGFNFYTEYKFGKQKFFIGVYNMLNTTNPLYFDVRRNKFEPNTYELHSISVLPILPALNYSLTF